MTPLNARISGLEPSAALAIDELSEQLRKSGRPVAKLGLGQSPFPVPAALVEALRIHASRKDYLPAAGLYELREALAQYHGRAGLDFTPDDVLIGPGSKELLFMLQIAFVGEIIVPTPAWFSCAAQARICSKTISFLHARAEHGFRITADELEAHLEARPHRRRLLILNHPSNATGGAYEQEEMAALADVARRFEMIILSDEIHAELHHRGAHTSIAARYPEGTIVSTGLSKSWAAAGWRLGAFCLPKNLRGLLDAMANVASETYTATCAPVQHAAIAAFRSGLSLERYLWSARHILAALGREVSDRLWRAGILVLPPVAAFYLFPDFEPFRQQLHAREISTNAELCRRLLEEAGVALVPGSAFGRPADELTARIAYVDFDGAKAMAAIEAGADPASAVDAAFLERHCGSVLDAIDRTIAWVRR